MKTGEKLKDIYVNREELKNFLFKSMDECKNWDKIDAYREILKWLRENK